MLTLVTASGAPFLRQCARLCPRHPLFHPKQHLIKVSSGIEYFIMLETQSINNRVTVLTFFVAFIVAIRNRFSTLDNRATYP